MRRAVAKVKRALMEAKEDRTDVRVDRQHGLVYIDKKTVASWNGEKILLKGEALLLKENMEELIAERPEISSEGE